MLSFCHSNVALSSGAQRRRAGDADDGRLHVDPRDRVRAQRRQRALLRQPSRPVRLPHQRRLLKEGD